MPNQDLVAERLMRPSAEEMHRLIRDFGSSHANHLVAWQDFVRLDATIQLINHHGWTIAEYLNECKKFTCIARIYWFMIRQFVNSENYYIHAGII